MSKEHAYIHIPIVMIPIMPSINLIKKIYQPVAPGYRSNYMTNDEFKERVLLGNHAVDLSKTNYTGLRNPVIVTCKFCNTDRSVFLYDLIGSSNQPCKKCMKVGRTDTLEVLTEKTLRRFYMVHGDEFDYSLVKYSKSTKKVIILCRSHGSFLQLPRAHIKGARCPKCAKKDAILRNRVKRAPTILNNVDKVCESQ